MSGVHASGEDRTGASPFNRDTIGRLLIVSLAPEPPDPALVDRLAHALSLRIPAPVVLQGLLPDDPEWLSAERSQLLSDHVIDSLIERYPLAQEGTPADWVLAVTAADLRGYRRPFVFGEATLGGAWAVLSTARFGAPGDELDRRLLKESLHELGHVAGLPHCDAADCVMRPSIDVAGVDAKGTDFCDRCRGRENAG